MQNSQIKKKVFWRATQLKGHHNLVLRTFSKPYLTDVKFNNCQTWTFQDIRMPGKNPFLSRGLFFEDFLKIRQEG